MFRPCIDLHEGKVKQIVGSTLTGVAGDAELVTHFVANQPATWYAELYKHYNLRGGHVIMLGPGNEQQAREALAVWPGGMQIGGGISLDNAREWLDAGASHVIVNSLAFKGEHFDEENLSQLVRLVGQDKIVLDLSCRIRNGQYYIVTERWQKFTHLPLNEMNLNNLSTYCDEFLIHAVDVEGKAMGIDCKLVALLADNSPIPATYAGGAKSIDDLDRIEEVGHGRVDLTIGTALDIFGGTIKFNDVILWNRKHQGAETAA